MVQTATCVTDTQLQAILGSSQGVPCRGRYTLQTLDDSETFNLPITFLVNPITRNIRNTTQQSTHRTIVTNSTNQDPKIFKCKIRLLQADMVTKHPRTRTELQDYIDDFLGFLYKGDLKLIDNQTQRYTIVRLGSNMPRVIDRTPFTAIYEFDFDLTAFEDPFEYSTGIKFQPVYGDYVDGAILLNSYTGLECLQNSNGDNRYLIYHGYTAGTADPQSTGQGNYTITNNGNYFVYPEMEFTMGGSSSFLTVENLTTGDAFTLTTNLNSGDIITVDMESLLIEVNGNSVLSETDHGFTNHLVIAPGDNDVQITVDASTSFNSLFSYRERWI